VATHAFRELDDRRPAAPAPHALSRELLSFETLTLAPIDRVLVDAALLDGEEIAWLDAYHARVRTELSPLVDGDTAAWLADATRPLGQMSRQ